MDAQNTQIIAEKRKRGGVSVPCPQCGAESHVVQTRRRPPDLINAEVFDGDVWRDRECRGESRHRFWTIEQIFADNA